MRRAALALPIVAAIAACASAAPAPRAPPRAEVPEIDHTDATPDVDQAALDTRASPCADFYAFACGGWIAKTPMPDDAALWTRGFGPIEARAEELTRAVLEGRRADEDPDLARAQAFYASCTDEAAASARGLADLDAELGAIDAVEDATSLARAVARLHAAGAHALFAIGAEPDTRPGGAALAYLTQAGFGLPDRAMYEEDEPRDALVRGAYEAHVARTLALAGAGEEAAPRIVALERALAHAASTKVELHAPSRGHHVMTWDALAAIAPSFDWATYFAELGIPRDASIDVAQPTFLEAMAHLAKATPLDVMRAYLRWQLLRAAAPSLGARFVAEHHAMRRVLLGTLAPPPRWQQCVRATRAAFPDVTARAWAAAARAESARRDATAIVSALEDALRARIAASPWMDRATRERALAKLAKVAIAVGAPATWRRYEGLTIDPRSFPGNALRAARFSVARALAPIGRAPADETRWPIPADAPAAFYDPARNAIVLPAAALAPPLLDASRGAPANLGALGMIVGHELTHGFDDAGREYDEAGALAPWWSEATLAEYDARARCVTRQFDGYASEGARVQGELTVGEDVADLGGLELALAALARAPNEARAPRGPYGPEQTLFLAFAQTWCTRARPEALRLRVATNAHAPPRWRVNGTVSNMPEFAQAFGCRPGDPMVRAARCSIWQ